MTIDGNSIVLEPEIFINGLQREMSSNIQDRDSVVVSLKINLASALEKLDTSHSAIDQSFMVYVNHQPLKLHNRETLYFIGSMPIKPTYKLSHNDRVSIRKSPLPTIAEIANHAAIKLFEQMNVIFNGEQITIRKKRHSMILNGETTVKRQSSKRMIISNSPLRMKSLLYLVISLHLLTILPMD